MNPFPNISIISIFSFFKGFVNIFPPRPYSPAISSPLSFKNAERRSGPKTVDLSWVSMIT
jgi:hypothetical protein